MTPEDRKKASRCQQLSAEWFAYRTGRVTGSNVSRALKMLSRASNGKKAGESSAERERYKVSLMSEILTGIPVENYVTPAMDTGRELEPVAVAEYEFHMGIDETEQTGFWIHPKIERFGSSPDRLIGSAGVLEVKCPLPTTHIEYLMGQVCPEEYYDQVQAEIACTGREWADFVSFCPIMPPDLKLFRVRVPRDEHRIAAIEEGVSKFIEEVIQAIAALRGVKLDDQLRQSIASIPEFDPKDVSAEFKSEADAYEDAAGYIDGLRMAP